MKFEVVNLGRQLGEHWILRQINFTVNSGECLGITGPSGSGKTTLLRCLAWLDDIQEGTISVGGRPREKWFSPTYRAKIIYLHQRPYFSQDTVRKELQYIFTWREHKNKEYDEDQILAWLEVMNKSPRFLDKSPGDLSGGESQIAAFLRAFQLNPSVLLLDEPTASLEGKSKKNFESLLSQWLEGGERSSILVSHNPKQIERVATKTYSLEGVKS